MVDDANATLSLDGFDDQCSDRILVQRGVELLEIPLEDRDARGERPEGKSIARPVGRGERAEQPSVEGAAQCDDLVLRLAQCARPAARELERALVRLCAGVAEE